MEDKISSNNMTDLNTTNTLSNPLNRWITYGIWLMITLIYIPIPAVPGTLITFTLFILSLYSMNNETRGFALMCFAAPVLGALFFVLHIPLTAYFICLFLGLVFLRNYIKSSLNINEEFIYFSLGDTQYSCRIPVEKSTKANFNQTEQFYFNMEKCHIFDLETEENLTL